MLSKVKRKLFKKRVESTPDERLLFVHIPKCGGQSVVMALRNIFPGVNPRNIEININYQSLRSTRKTWNSEDWNVSWVKFRQQYLAHLLSKKHQLVLGHMPLSIEDQAPVWNDYKVVTVMREPVERFISNYIYDKTGPGVNIPNVLEKEASIKDELECYLNTAEAKWMAMEQVIMLGGIKEDQLIPEKILERAKSNLKKFHLIGFSESMNTFAEGLSQLFQKDVSIPRINTTAHWLDQKGNTKGDYNAAFDTEIKEKIKQLCDFEYDLYNTAKSLK